MPWGFLSTSDGRVERADSYIDGGAPLQTPRRSGRVAREPGCAVESLAVARSPVCEAEGALLATFCQALGLLAAEGASIGLLGWSLRVWRRLEPYVAHNILTPANRGWVVLDMAIGVAVAVLIGLLLSAWKRRAGVAAALRLGRRSAPLILAGFLPLLFNWRLWVGRDLAFLALLGTVALSLQALTRTCLSTAPVFGEFRLPRPAWFSTLRAGVSTPVRWVAGKRVMPLLLVCCCSLFYAVFFSFHTIQMHYKLGTSSFDLGLENNLVWNAVHWGPLFKMSPLGGPTANHLGLHQTYLAYVIGIVYRLAPRPETLLVIQATLVGFAAVPLYFVARRRLGAWLAGLISLLYVFYPPVHGSNLYDFHYITLAPFFLWLTLALVLARRDILATLAVMLTLSVREDVSALLATLGLYLIFSRERPRAGAILTLVGATYFVALKLVIMPRFLDGVDAFIHQYQGMLGEEQKGFAGVLTTAVANPGFTLQKLLDVEKVRYTLQIMVPLACFAWRRPIGLLCTVPGFFFTLLSTDYWPLQQISFQYTAYWTSFLFLAVIANLGWVGQHVGRASRLAWIVALVFAMAAGSHQHGALIQQNTLRGGFQPYSFGITPADRKNHDDLYGLIAQVPADSVVVSSETVVPHVSSRENSYSLRHQTFDAEYIIAMTPLRGDELAQFRPALESGTFGVVEHRGRFILARRGHSTAKNQAVLDQPL